MSQKVISVYRDNNSKLNVTHFFSEDIERDEQTLLPSPPPTPQLQQTTIGSIGNNPKKVTSESDLTGPTAYKRILVVDDDTDITLTFKSALEGYYHDDKRFEVYTYNNPLVALSEFKPHFYDLLLTDINLPDMNGFELSQKIIELDVNISFISAGEVNIEALREIHPKINFGCFIKKPVSIDYLIKRLRAELE
jgi:CheY-like chemotaxis protein